MVLSVLASIKEGRDKIFHHKFSYIQTIATNEVPKYVTFYSSNLV